MKNELLLRDLYYDKDLSNLKYYMDTNNKGDDMKREVIITENDKYLCTMVTYADLRYRPFELCIHINDEVVRLSTLNKY